MFVGECEVCLELDETVFQGFRRWRCITRVPGGYGVQRSVRAVIRHSR
jgi:hypothetical protein